VTGCAFPIGARPTPLPYPPHESPSPVTSHLRADWPHLLRWLRSPKGLFAGVLLVLTAPAVWHAGWALVWPSLLAAMLTAAVCDLPLLRWRDGEWSVPDGALLTGWLIALVLSPHQPWHVAAVAAL